MNRCKTKKGKQEATLMRKFDSLVNRMSPENLHCDGEISRAQAEQRRRQIMREWASLEKLLGRKVTEGDVWDYHTRMAQDESG